ncbi:MAG: TRAP transporter small permease [Lachnospiraceae bacterium]|jgi:TRAP-type C4-dicarboxylate transport system permease small subunit|nr:TRAP transporter small permease [Lachnospiraceae bacterium]
MMTKAVKALDKLLNTLISCTAVAMLAVMSVVVFAQVVFRLVHASIPWSEEVSKYLLVWCTFLGAALCVRRKSLVGLELLSMLIPKKLNRHLQLFVYLLSVIILGVITVVGIRTLPMIWRQSTPVLKISMGLVYAAIPVGSILMLVNTLIVAYYHIAGEEE